MSRETVVDNNKEPLCVLLDAIIVVCYGFRISLSLRKTQQNIYRCNDVRLDTGYSKLPVLGSLLSCMFKIFHKEKATT